MYKEKSIKTNNKVELIDITDDIRNVVKNSNLKSGILVVNIPHTTAAVTINENADPSVKEDIIKELNKVIPFNDNYSHIEGNSSAHIKSSIIGCDQTIIIENGDLKLGRWQGIIFCEFDGPRTRKINLKLISN